MSEINKENFGIKLLVKHSSPSHLLDQISAGNYSFNNTNIIEVSHEEFLPMKKITSKDTMHVLPAPYIPFIASKKKFRREFERRTS